jgi:hypothetical protein
VAAEPYLARPSHACLAHLHQVKHDLARDVTADAVDVQVTAASDPAHQTTSVKKCSKTETRGENAEGKP